MNLLNMLDSKDRLLVLPELNDFALCMIQRFEQKLTEQQLTGSIILIETHNVEGKNCVFIKEEEMRELLRHYQMYEFTRQIIWGSLSQPFGRNWNNLIDSGCMSKAQVMEAMLDF